MMTQATPGTIQTACFFRSLKAGSVPSCRDTRATCRTFGEDLTDAEIEAILVYIKSTWPERQREFQAEVSANDTGG